MTDWKTCGLLTIEFVFIFFFMLLYLFRHADKVFNQKSINGIIDVFARIKIDNWYVLKFVIICEEVRSL